MIPTEQWPAMMPELRPREGLQPHPTNSRTHSEAQVSLVASAMERWGFTIPVLVTEEGVIIAGHCRVQAAETLGLTEVPVLVARGWSEEMIRAYVIADNQLTDMAEWDVSILTDELRHLRSHYEDDLTFLGFDTDRLSILLTDEDDSLFDLGDPAPATTSAPGAEPKTKTADGYAQFSMVLPVETRNRILAKLRDHQKAQGLETLSQAFIDYMGVSNG